MKNARQAQKEAITNYKKTYEKRPYKPTFTYEQTESGDIICKIYVFDKKTNQNNIATSNI